MDSAVLRISHYALQQRWFSQDSVNSKQIQREIRRLLTRDASEAA